MPCSYDDLYNIKDNITTIGMRLGSLLPRTNDKMMGVISATESHTAY